MERSSVSALLIALVAVALGYGLGRFRVRAIQNQGQNLGEAIVSRALKENFGTSDYHLLNHVTLQLEDGTTQIDHILVSRFGVFVIETKHLSGWIFGNPDQSTWTQVLFGRKSKFQNPIFQNRRHVRAVQQLLDFLPHESISPVVIFSGEAEFKTETPSGVFSIPGFIEHLRSPGPEVMSLNRLQFAVGRLETARLQISRETDIEHMRSLERRHGRRKD
jgi:hypothetical protein